MTETNQPKVIITESPNTNNRNNRPATPEEKKKVDEMFDDCGSEVRNAEPSQQVILQEIRDTSKVFPDIDAKVKEELKKLLPDLQEQGVSTVLLDARAPHEQYEGGYYINAQGGNTFQVARMMNSLAIKLTQAGIDTRLGSLECPAQGIGIGTRIPKIGATKQ